MEKITCKSSEHSVLSTFGYAVPNSEIDYLVGRVCTHLEALGMPPSQEKAAKDLIRKEIYNTLQNTTYMPGGLMSVVSEYSYKEKEMAREEGLPSGHDADFELTYLPKI